MVGEACGKLGQQEPSSQGELATDEGLRAALSTSLAGPTPKPSKHLPFWHGPRTELWLGWGGASVRRGIEAPDLHPEAIFPGSFLPHSGSLPVLEMDQALLAKSS